MFDFCAHLIRQMVFSKATFGLGPRTNGVLNHIEKEIVEVRKELKKMEDRDPTSSGQHSLSDEWVDLVILSLDGLSRSVWATYPHLKAHEIAPMVIELIESKQGKNELRDWPDWRTADPEKAIEHVRGKHD